MSAAPIWSIVAGVVSLGIIFLGIYAHKLVSIMLDVTQPCQHDGVWTGATCDCSISRGVWAGSFCEQNNCSNRGRPVQDDGLWSCQCGSIRSDAGVRCDKCYTLNCSQHDPGCSVDALVDDSNGVIVDGRNSSRRWSGQV